MAFAKTQNAPAFSPISPAFHCLGTFQIHPALAAQ